MRDTPVQHNLTTLSQLFDRSLAPDYDDDGAWEAVNALRAEGSRDVFEMAAEWLRASQPMARARAADVLGQLGVGPQQPHAFPQEACNLLLDLLKEEAHPRVIASAIIALGHIHDPRAPPIIYKFVSHEDAVPRHAVAFTLGCYSDDPASIPGLMLLMMDVDDDVRDWATFSLGVWSEQDSGLICDALAQRLHDSFDNVRLEAIAGLSKRGDIRALPALADALESTPDPAPTLIEGACELLALDAPPRHWTACDFAKALRQLLDDDARPVWRR
jgi:HEAT repeats/PBS lyase HEAT-like repeat